MNKILLIGCGHMGSALLNAWHNKTSNYFSVVDPNKHVILSRTYKQRVSIFQSVDIIIKFYLLVLLQEKKYLSLIIFYHAIINLYVLCLICLLWLKKGYPV